MSFLRKIYMWLYQREYRPNKYFRIPIYFIWARYAIQAKHPFFFSVINPGVKSLWFLDDPKTDTYKLLDKKYYPQSIILQLPISEENIKKVITNHSLEYPIIIKPDGDSVQGNNVYLIQEQKDWKKYLKKLPHWAYLLQEYITGEEYSIYYYRYPDKKDGNILGVTKKIYPTIVGDGKSTVWEIIKNHDRYNRYYILFKNQYNVNMEEILPLWISKELATIWNHCKWSLFLDRSSHASIELTKHIDKIFSNSNLYLFRLDVKGKSREEISNGKFKIIESNNGVFAEPTYMYDPDYKIINAYKQISKIWHHWYHIAIYNSRKGIPYITTKDWFNYIKKFLSN